MLCHAEIKRCHGLIQSRLVSLGLLHDDVLSEQTALVWSSSVTPRLSLFARGQSTWQQLSVYSEKHASDTLRGRIWTCSYPQSQQQTTAPAWPPTQSVIFLFCLPKGQINNEPLLMHAHTLWGQTTLQASWQAYPFPPNGKLAGVPRKRLQIECMSSWKIEHCLPFTFHSTFLGHGSIFIPNVEKLFSTALVSWQTEDPGCSDQSP